MLTTNLAKLFNKDLKKLAEELKAYSDESNLWKVSSEITNSAGNLALHLEGNLKHFIGAILGKTDYVRKRDREFSDKDVSRKKLIQGVDEARKVVNEVLPELSEEDLEANFPVKLFDGPQSTSYYLVHFYGHLNYHLGQINYHRRLLDRKKTS